MNIGITELLLILVIVLLLFGSKKLRNLGSDLGSAVRGFRKSMNEGEGDATQDQAKLTKPDAAHKEGDHKS